MSSTARKLRRRLERETVVVTIGVRIPDGIFPWERELLAAHIPELVHAVLNEPTDDEQEQD